MSTKIIKFKKQCKNFCYSSFVQKLTNLDDIKFQCFFGIKYEELYRTKRPRDVKQNDSCDNFEMKVE